jgi:uncharacterized cupin superfamily protein
MSFSVRRVVTAFDGKRSYFASDETVDSRHPPLIGNDIARLWAFDKRPTMPHDGRPTIEGAAFFPPPGGLRVLIWTCPPNAVAMPEERTPEAIAETEAIVPGMLEVEGGPDGLHVTATIDVHYVLEGRLEIVLDGDEARELGPGDLLVINGGGHVWRNTTDQTARVLLLLYGAQPYDAGGTG